VYRAYSLLHVKALEDERRVITGWATTPEPDRRGDVIEPFGVKFQNPLPLLLYHDREKPVGRATFAAPTAGGIAFEAELPRVLEAGPLRDRIEEAWQSIKAGLIFGVSIGFRALGDVGRSIQELASGGLRFLDTEVVELSLVTVPANPRATIATIKSLDLAAPGRNLSGVSDFPVVEALKGAPGMQQTIPEQITAFEHTRAAKAARQTNLMTEAGQAGLTLDAEQAQEYDALAAEVKSIDAHLVRLHALEESNIATATPVPAGPTGRPPLSVISVRPNVPKGTGFTRYAMALAACKGNRLEAAEWAKQWKDSTPEVELILKAAIAAGNTTDATWAGPLAVKQRLTEEFIELLRPATIIGKIPGMRKVPFNVSVAAQTLGGTYGWVGQGAPKPVTKLGFGEVTLGITKAAGIIVLTEELVRTSSPSAEELCRRDMIAGIASFLDGQFLDPTVTEIVNVRPASITNGVTPITAGATLDADLKALVGALVAGGYSTVDAVWIMSETNALAIGLEQNPLGQSTYPGLGPTGGTLLGMPVVTSQLAGNNLVLVYAPAILIADDGGVTVDVSREASIQMDTAPMSPPDATVVFTSLWQMNQVGLRAERFINYKRAMTGSVQYVTKAYTLLAGEVQRGMPEVEQPRTGTNKSAKA
jgi:HK97 family phage major capsid protein